MEEGKWYDPLALTLAPEVTSRANTLLAKAGKLHNLRVETADADIQVAFQRVMAEYVNQLVTLASVGTDPVVELKDRVKAEVDNLEHRINILMSLSGEEIMLELDKAVPRQVRLLFQLQAIETALQVAELNKGVEVELEVEVEPEMKQVRLL